MMIAAMSSGAFRFASARFRAVRGARFSRRLGPVSHLVVIAIIAFGIPLPSHPNGFATAATTNPFADLGLPEIAVTITNRAFEGAPKNVPAGRYVLAVTNAYQESTDETDGAALLRLPDVVEAEEFITSVQDEESDWPADWYYETTLAGGAYAALESTAYAVVDLTAGDWILWSEVPGSPQPPVRITVTGEFPVDPVKPAADVTVVLSDFDIAFQSPLGAGPRIMEIVNAGEQPHFLFFGGVSEGTTAEEAQAAIDAYWDPESAPAAPFSFAETPELFATGDQSAGTTAWYAIDFPSGTVVATCFVSDPATGLSHDMLGMTEIVEIG
jgi:hypothetical protein